MIRLQILFATGAELLFPCGVSVSEHVCVGKCKEPSDSQEGYTAYL